MTVTEPVKVPAVVGANVMVTGKVPFPEAIDPLPGLTVYPVPVTWIDDTVRGMLPEAALLVSVKTRSVLVNTFRVPKSRLLALTDS